MDVPVEPSPRCLLYRPGHNVHYIQARKAREEGGEGVPVEIVRLIDPDLIVLACGMECRRFHNHDLQRLREAVDVAGARAHMYERKSLLRLRSGAFSIATPQWWDPDCGAGPTHGFLASPGQARRALRRVMGGVDPADRRGGRRD